MEKKIQLRTRRYFSDELRREIVKKIERKDLTISGASREYEVSDTSLYRWIYRYSLHLKKGIRLVMEKNSHGEQIKLLKDRLAAMEQVVGQKQMEIDILNKMLEFGSEDVGFDIKKKFGGKSSSGTKTTKGSTSTKQK